MTASAYNLQDAIQWAHLVNDAYNLYQANKHNTNPKPPQNLTPGWNLIANLTVDAVAGLIDNKELMGFLVQSQSDPSHIGIVYRGTDSLMDWLEDFEFRKVPFTDIPNGGHTEHGFTQLYRSVLVEHPGDADVPPQTLNDFLASLHMEPWNAARVTVTGHSLGAALAILTAAGLAVSKPELPLEIYSFAAPRVGDHTFAATYNALVPNSYRIYNKPDLVPHVPISLLGYEQVDAGVEIDSHDDPNIKRNIIAYHSILTYIDVLTRQEQGAVK